MSAEGLKSALAALHPVQKSKLGGVSDWPDIRYHGQRSFGAGPSLRRD